MASQRDRSIRLDHLVVVAASLEAGARFVEQALGIAPGPGRRHPHMGTHNLLLSLGPSVYLEVAAIDPQAAPIARPRWFGLDDLTATSAPRLAAWVADTNDIQSVASPERGEVETMRREGRTWQMTVTADGRLPLSGAAPVLIQRSGGAHPAAALPESGLRLRALRICHPAATEVRTLLSNMGLSTQASVSVAFGSTCSLVADIDTPSGLRSLGDA